MLTKYFYPLWFIIFGQSFAQENTKMFSFYEDNDLINISGKGTDRGYTNGTRLEFFYSKDTSSNNWPYKLMPKANKSSTTTYSWSITQTMITPGDIEKKVPDSKDYSYSGALFLAHSLHSSSPTKKLNVHSEWILGVLGPPSFAAQAQIFIHKITHSKPPLGWPYQLPADLLLNYNLTIEKHFFSLKNAAEIIGGGQFYAGSMRDGISLYTVIRIGKFNSYFNGLFNQNTHQDNPKKNFQFHMVAKPGIEWTPYNALLQGGLFNKNSPVYKGGTKKTESLLKQLEVGLVASIGNCGLSINQKISSSPLPSFQSQKVGNISLFYTW